MVKTLLKELMKDTYELPFEQKKTDVTCVKGHEWLGYKLSEQLGWYHDYYGRPFGAAFYFY